MFVGMNAAVRAVVRMGIYIGCRVFLIKEVCSYVCHILLLHTSCFCVTSGTDGAASDNAGYSHLRHMPAEFSGGGFLLQTKRLF